MTAPDPAALLAAMEAAALAYQKALRAYLDGPYETYESVEASEREYEKATDPAAVLALCAALRASQEREAAAVAAEREAIAHMVETHVYVTSNFTAPHLAPSKRATDDMHHRTIAAAIRARKDAAP